ncbi:MAG: protein kinase, partial [Euryarchaeota archaeon]
LFYTPLYAYQAQGYYTFPARSELGLSKLTNDDELMTIYIHSALLFMMLIYLSYLHRNLDIQHQMLLKANGMDTKNESVTVRTESNNLINAAANSISSPRIEAPQSKDLVSTKQENANTNIPQDETDVLSMYEKQELIAKGGMATVYMAINRTTRKQVVWKEAHGDFNPLSVSNMKIDGECELLELLDHPRLPKYIARGSVSGDFGQENVVLIEEFIEGGSLQETVEQCRKMGAIIPQDRIIDMLGKTCEPLIYMATLEEPIYHRDLKPHNIIVHPDRGPVLIDFGLAKIVSAGSDISVTRGGSGTWTAPERDSGISGPFTDVYSLGKCLYYLITYKVPPTIVTEREKQEMIQNGAPEWLADLMLNAAWPVHDQRIQTIRHFNEILQSEGNLSFDRNQSSSSGDFTTWS